jgi:hypothetical protein
MKRIRYHRLAAGILAALALMMIGSIAGADTRVCPGSTPAANSAVVHTRIFNNCPSSTVTVTNTYPALVDILDEHLDCFGFANRHAWAFSTDGVSVAQFENCSLYRFCADVTLSGTGDGEGGLRLSPWFSPDLVDGVYMLNTQSGEIACFGGRLPFFSFTGKFGLHYVKGTTVHVEIIYNPQLLNAIQPGTITYNLVIGGTPYSSGPISFDQGNTTEDPPHGLWGELFPAFPGGYLQCFLGQGVDVSFEGSFANICFDGDAATPARSSTWGQLKTLYR